MIRFIQGLNILPRWIILLIDLGILCFSFVLAYLIRFDFSLSDSWGQSFTIGLLIYLLSGLIAIFITQSYSGIIRHTGLQDGYRIAYTNTIGIIFTLIVNYFFLSINEINLIPLGVIVMAYLNSLIFLISYRIAVKYFFNYYSSVVHKPTHIVIFGSGQNGQITKQIIDSDPAFKTVAFIEDNSRKVGKVINGVKIFNARSELSRFFKQMKVSEVILSDPSISLQRKNELVDICLKNDVKVRSIPTADKWIKGELSYNQIKSIKIEDLLGRESIKLNNIHVSNDLRDKTVLITGAAGSIGSELARQVLLYNPSKVILFDQSETGLFHLGNEIKAYQKDIEIAIVVGDIGDQFRVESVFRSYLPNIVFHAAAYKHVPLMEKNVREAFGCNVIGTKCIADISVKYGVNKFVMISTDKAVNPTSMMGATKRLAEKYVRSLYNSRTKSGLETPLFITTRFGNVLGSNGSVIPVFKKQIENREPITVTHPEVTRYFMTIAEACQLVLEAGALGNGSEIYLFDMGESIKIVDLAKKMIRLSGLELGKDIEIKFIGLRAGEKLYEELLADEENTIQTHHPKILIANNTNEEPYKEFNSNIENILVLSRENATNHELMVAIKELVPEYTETPPNHKHSCSNNIDEDVKLQAQDV